MKTTRKKIRIMVEKSNTGFSAYTLDYPVYTTAKSVSELIENAFEATSLYFEDQKVRIERKNLKFEFDLKQFFLYYRIINARFLADKIGMNPTLLSQYVQGHKKPSESQTKRILTGINKIGQELSEINLILK
jgi:predicted RNase H-like HicB family nuclease